MIVSENMSREPTQALVEQVPSRAQALRSRGLSVISEGAALCQASTEGSFRSFPGGETHELRFGARQAALRPRQGESRAVKAGRRPPEGEALRARSVSPAQLTGKPARASSLRLAGLVIRLLAPHGSVVRTRCGSISRARQCWRGSPGAPGCRSSLRRGEATWSGSAAARRAQSEGRPRRFAGAMTNSELAPGCVRSGCHASALARQRTSPSRRP